ncbi:MAG: thermonuclease family protein [Hyphomicrobiales bacterium]
MRRSYKSKSRKIIDWAVLVLIAGGMAIFISRLPQTKIAGPVQVLDGDSLVVEGNEIRLYGIDAPEGRQMCQDKTGSQYSCGKLAARALRTLVSGSEVDCVVVTKDRYARNVSRCIAKGKELNREMVRQGWAVAYRSHAQDYLATENEARSAGRGIWQGAFERPGEWRRKQAAAADAAVGKPPPD